METIYKMQDLTADILSSKREAMRLLNEILRWREEWNKYSWGELKEFEKTLTELIGSIELSEKELEVCNNIRYEDTIWFLQTRYLAIINDIQKATADMVRSKEIAEEAVKELLANHKEEYSKCGTVFAKKLYQPLRALYSSLQYTEKDVNLWDDIRDLRTQLEDIIKKDVVLWDDIRDSRTQLEDNIEKENE